MSKEYEIESIYNNYLHECDSRDKTPMGEVDFYKQLSIWCIIHGDRQLARGVPVLTSYRFNDYSLGIRMPTKEQDGSHFYFVVTKEEADSMEAKIIKREKEFNENL